MHLLRTQPWNIKGTEQQRHLGENPFHFAAGASHIHGLYEIVTIWINLQGFMPVSKWPRKSQSTDEALGERSKFRRLNQTMNEMEKRDFHLIVKCLSNNLVIWRAGRQFTSCQQWLSTLCLSFFSRHLCVFCFQLNCQEQRQRFDVLDGSWSQVKTAFCVCVIIPVNDVVNRWLKSRLIWLSKISAGTQIHINTNNHNVQSIF